MKKLGSSLFSVGGFRLLWPRGPLLDFSLWGLSIGSIVGAALARTAHRGCVRSSQAKPLRQHDQVLPTQYSKEAEIILIHGVPRNGEAR